MTTGIAISNNNCTKVSKHNATETNGCADLKNLSDSDLLTFLIARCLPVEQAQARATMWLNRTGGLNEVIALAEKGNLWHKEPEHDPSDLVWMHLIQACSELSNRQIRNTIKRGTALTSPTDTLDYLQHCLQGRRREVFHCLFLDTRHRVICHEELFQGSIDGACVYPRVVAEHALRHNAAAVIVAHNHPSGVTEPSLADQAITRRLKDALGLLEIRLLDHFVIGDTKPVSMAARGMV